MALGDSLPSFVVGPRFRAADDLVHVANIFHDEPWPEGVKYWRNIAGEVRARCGLRHGNDKVYTVLDAVTCLACVVDRYYGLYTLPGHPEHDPAHDRSTMALHGD